MSTNRFEVAIKLDEIITLADQSIPVSMIPPRPARTMVLAGLGGIMLQSAYTSPRKHPVVLGLLDVEDGSSHL